MVGQGRKALKMTDKRRKHLIARVDRKKGKSMIKLANKLNIMSEIWQKYVNKISLNIIKGRLNQKWMKKKIIKKY